MHVGRLVNVGRVVCYVGHCKACAYHTSGAHCDVCYPGYDGNALHRSCSQWPISVFLGHPER